MSNRGCSDGGCPFRKRGGMRTNGGCVCFGDGSRMTPHERAQLRQWVREMRDELELLGTVAKAARTFAAREWFHEGSLADYIDARTAVVRALAALDKQGGDHV